MAKNQAKIERLLLKIIHILHSHYHSKIIGGILKNMKMNMKMKMKMNMKNRSHRYDILYGSRTKYGQKYSK